MTSFGELGEFGFIDRIARFNPQGKGVIRGIGDDCAVFEGEDGWASLFTTDLMVDGVHFHLELIPAEGLGYKLLAVNLSDIAAMAGVPERAVVSLGIPGDMDPGYMERVYTGLHEAAAVFDVTIAGGDTTRSPTLVLNLALTGRVRKDRAIYRSGARVGDEIYVSGTLGDSAAGLEALAHEFDLPKDARAELIREHFRPEPRISLGQALSETRAVTSMIDLSDGISSDLAHICRQSGVSATIEGGAIPISEAYRKFCDGTSRSLLPLALSGGEDYELLFTVDPDGRKRVDGLSERGDIPLLARIGRIERGEGEIRIETEKGVRVLESGGYDHFKESSAGSG